MENFKKREKKKSRNELTYKLIGTTYFKQLNSFSSKIPLPEQKFYLIESSPGFNLTF